ncbi:MAG: prephenate dehydrogenase/arogenate dehydrogenase family protein [Actinomycetota bacterium]|nr:prephenate dehydrogenase/arogenate dehydrogenase family protein [Actinomycetota bacterium]
MSEPETVVVVGTGLIGTSIAMAALRGGHAVTGYDADPRVLSDASKLARFSTSSTLEDCVRGASLAFVCTPIPTISSVVAAVLEGSGAAVSDVGSVKSHVVEEVELAAGEGAARFVGGHPMGGSERSGPEGASPSVLDGIAWVLTPTEGTSGDALARVERFVSSVGAQPIRMDPQRHDRLVAVVSHLPQVASTALMGLVAEQEVGDPEILQLAAAGFRDLTRLAASNPALWAGILRSNREAFSRALDLYIARLEHLRTLVADDGPELEEAFADAKRARLGLAAKPQVRAGVAVLQVPVPDRPGVLAELTATMGAAEVNIEDLQIVHSPEGGRGRVHLTIAASQTETALRCLTGGGFEPIRLA